MFKNMKELEEYIEYECNRITAEPERCYICGKFMVDKQGYTDYILVDEYAPDDKFCSEECAKEFLIHKIGIKGDE